MSKYMPFKLKETTDGEHIALPGLGQSETVSTSTSSAASTITVDSGVVQLTCDVACFVTHGSAPTATTSDHYLEALLPQRFYVTPGDKIAAITAAGTGNLYVSELV